MKFKEYEKEITNKLLDLDKLEGINRIINKIKCFNELLIDTSIDHVFLIKLINQAFLKKLIMNIDEYLLKNKFNCKLICESIKLKFQTEFLEINSILKDQTLLV